MNKELMKVEYESFSGITVKLDADTVRNTLTRGNGKITDQEVAMFLRTCQAKKLDPLEQGETYLIKYDDKMPANMVVGYHAYVRRAERFPDYRGYKAGVVVLRNNELFYKEGAAVYGQIGEELIGGWCRVFREMPNGSIQEFYQEVSLDEYSTGKSNWNAKPGTMIRKCAVAQAFRSAFPNEYEGLYTPEEMVASGAIPPVDENNDVIMEVADEDPVITEYERRELLLASEVINEDIRNDIMRELIHAEGFDNSRALTKSAFERIMAKVKTFGNKETEQE
jgi:phage recombination protein Bet